MRQISSCTNGCLISNLECIVRLCNAFKCNILFLTCGPRITRACGLLTAGFYCPKIVPTSFAAKLTRRTFAIQLNCLECGSIEKRLKQLVSYRIGDAPLGLSTLLPLLPVIHYLFLEQSLGRRKKKNILKTRSNWVRDGRGDVCLTV